jgi:hypothetical protein
MMRDKLASLPPFTLGLLAAAPGLVLFLLATRHGLALGGDSASYADLANNLANGRGPVFTEFGFRDQGLVSGHFPPGYPVLLAFTTTGTLLRTAHALMFLLVGGLVVMLAHSRTAAVVASLLATWITVQPDAVVTYAAAMSELSFVVLLLAAAVGVTQNRPGLALVALAALPLVRHVGVVILPSAVAAFVLRKQWKPAAGVAVAAVPYVAWRLWLKLMDAPADRVLAWHPPAFAEVRQMLATFGGWLMPGTGTDLRIILGIGVIAAVVWRCRRGDALAIATVAYAAAVLTARTLFDSSVPLAGRLWVPVMPLVAVSLVAAVPRWNRWTIGGLGCVVLVNLLVAIPPTIQQFREGGGYASPAWHASPTLAFVRDLPSGVPVSSNAADAVGLLLDRPAGLVPQTKFGTADGATNIHWRAQAAEMLDVLRERDGYVVYFDAVDRSGRRVAEDQWDEVAPLELVASFADGRVYRPSAASKSAAE